MAIRKRLSAAPVVDYPPEVKAWLSTGVLPERAFDVLLLEANLDAVTSAWRALRRGMLFRWPPGTRPAAWWRFDAPPMVEIRALWRDAYFTKGLREPRRRLGGSGVASHDVLNEVPYFAFGLPVYWVELCDVDPPVFESEAAYLD